MKLEFMIFLAAKLSWRGKSSINGGNHHDNSINDFNTTNVKDDCIIQKEKNSIASNEQ